MITKNKISINNIIEFIHTAMNNNTEIHISEFQAYCNKETESKIEFEVAYRDKQIFFFITPTYFTIKDFNAAYVSINYILTERDKLDIEALKLDVKEYNEEKALNLFDDFFKQVTETPTSIDNLDDDD